MTTEIKIVKNKFDIDHGHILTHDTEVLGVRAKVCMSLIDRWGLIAGKLDGEDSTGRAQYGLQTVDELVDRAIQTVDKAFAAFQEKDWLINAPTMEEMNTMFKEDDE